MIDGERDNVRVIIRRAENAVGDARLIPASVFKKYFVAFYNAVAAANKEIGHAKGREVFIQDLKIGSNEFAFSERMGSQQEQSSINLMSICSQAVYRNEFIVASSYPHLAKQ